ncbi:MAG: DUF1876 domain-containing protein [Actinocatenispora sp.]
MDIYLDEHDGQTYSEARLRSGADVQLVGVGRARLAAQDDDVPEIGDELATARALADLGNKLLLATNADIGQITHEEVHLTR